MAGLSALLVAALAVATNVGTDLLPSDWDLPRNRMAVWTVVGVLAVGVTTLAVAQQRLGGSATNGTHDSSVNPVTVRQRVTGVFGGTVIGSFTGPIFAGPVTIGPPASVAESAAAVTNVPPRNPDFVGRDDLLAQIRHWLSGGRVAVVAIHGMGGVGKSQLALEIAYHGRANDKYDITWWVRAESPLTMAEDLAGLAPALHVPVGVDRNTTIAAVYAALLRHARWLLIFDNAPSAQAVSAWLPTGDGHTLITSRNRVWGGLAQRVEVESFSRAESLDYLRQRTGREQHHADALAEVLGDLPLALAQAAGYLELHGGLSVSKYLQLYQDREGAGLLLAEGLPGYPHSVATTWLIHFEQLANCSPASLELLRLCSFLNPDTINLDLLLSEPEAMTGPLTSQLADVAARAVAQEHTIGALVGTGLVTRLDDHRIRVHRLVSQITRHQLSAPPDDVHQAWVQHCVRAVALIAKAPATEHELWESAEEILPHVLQCSEWISRYDLSDPPSVDLLRQAGHYLVRVSRFVEAEELLSLALRITERRCGADHHETARILSVIASLHHGRANYAEAEILYRRTLAIYEASQGEISGLDTAQTLNDLGWLFRKQGRYVAAEPLFRRALDIRERLLGPDAPAVARSVNDLGCLTEEMGRYAEAEQLYRRALNVRRQVLGASHPDTATSLWDLGWVYRRMGDYMQAETFFRQALDIRRYVLGEKSLETAMSCCDLAWVHLRTGRKADARPLLLESLSTRRHLVGDDHPETAMSLHELAFLAELDGDFKEARQLYDSALAVREGRLGHQHPDTASTISGLAHLYELEEDFARAESLYRDAISIHENIADIVHPDLPVILFSLARACATSGDLGEARALLERAMATARDLELGTAHPDIAPMLSMYGQLTGAAGGP